MLFLSGIIFLVSCGNNGTDSTSDAAGKDSKESPQYVYRLAIPIDYERIEYDFALLIGIPRENGDGYDYLAFDDEMDYNPYVAEFLMAYRITWYLLENKKDLGITYEDIERALLYVRDGELPITNVFQNEKIKEAINRTYYDYRNTTIYEPREGYGYRRYPYGDGDDLLYVRRVENEGSIPPYFNFTTSKSYATIDGKLIPAGALVIYYSVVI